MDILFELSQKKIQSVNMDFNRYLLDSMVWDARLIGIKGSRGVGKTTLLLQYLRMSDEGGSKSLFVSLDHIWFSRHSLVDLADYFAKRGGKRLFIDEVHKYPNWSQEIKNIYDDYPELQVVFTGSSLLEILNARADLSRRAVMYHLHGLSFREYASMATGIALEPVAMNDLLSRHTEIASEIIAKMRPLELFDAYLSSGYYPFFRESAELYHSRLTEVVNMILEVELPLLRGLDIAFTRKLQFLLLIFSESVPFIPNISKLSERIGINRLTLLAYLHYLEDAELITTLHRAAEGISRLQKPDKVFMQNTNLLHCLSSIRPNAGTIRETFFLNQVKVKHRVTLPERGDFLLDNSLLFEVGGTSKNAKQIAEQKNAYLVIDDIERGHANRIPLWMFGMLY